MKKMILISSLMILVGATSVAPVASAQQPPDVAGEKAPFAQLGELALGTIGYLAGLQPASKDSLDEHELFFAESLWQLARMVSTSAGTSLFGEQKGPKGHDLIAYGLAAAYLLGPSTVNQFLCQPLEGRETVEDGLTPLEFEHVVSDNDSLLCQTARAAQELAIYTPLIPAILEAIGFGNGSES